MSNNQEKKYSFIDLFAGCGGLTEGFLQTGEFEEVAAVEWLKPQVDTLRHRLQTRWNETEANSTVMHFDIQREKELFYGWLTAEGFYAYNKTESIFWKRQEKVAAGGLYTARVKNMQENILRYGGYNGKIFWNRRFPWGSQ